MDGHMYHEYRVHQLVQETIDAVMENGSSTMESDEATSLRDEFKSDISDKNDSDEEPILDESHLARAHWIQLHKTNKQGMVIQNAFIHLMDDHKHTRPIWQFGRNIDDKMKNWRKKLHDDFYFRHHCASVQAAFTMIMENKDDSSSLCRLLHEVGAHHFFYDAYEPHMELFQDAVLNAMKKILVGADELDEETEKSWIHLFEQIKKHMIEGIAIQRASYLKYAVTAQEFEEIRDLWKRIEDFGIDEAGRKLCETALQSYISLLRNYDLSLPIPEIPPFDSEVFNQFAQMTMAALKITIDNYDQTEGFVNLPEKLSEYAITCMILDVSPSLVRKAFMEGMVDMIQTVLDGRELSENERQTWCKIYRVLEQSILINIAEY